MSLDPKSPNYEKDPGKISIRNQFYHFLASWKRSSYGFFPLSYGTFKEQNKIPHCVVSNRIPKDVM